MGLSGGASFQLVFNFQPAEARTEGFSPQSLCPLAGTSSEEFICAFSGIPVPRHSCYQVPSFLFFFQHPNQLIRLETLSTRLCFPLLQAFSRSCEMNNFILVGGRQL